MVQKYDSSTQDFWSSIYNQNWKLSANILLIKVALQTKSTCFPSPGFSQIPQTAIKSQQSKTCYPSTSQLMPGGYGSTCGRLSTSTIWHYSHSEGLNLLWDFDPLNQIFFCQKRPHFSPLLRRGLLLSEKLILACQTSPPLKKNRFCIHFLKPAQF